MSLMDNAVTAGVLTYGDKKAVRERAGIVRAIINELEQV